MNLEVLRRGIKNREVLAGSLRERVTALENELMVLRAAETHLAKAREILHPASLCSNCGDLLSYTGSCGYCGAPAGDASSAPSTDALEATATTASRAPSTDAPATPETTTETDAPEPAPDDISEEVDFHVEIVEKGGESGTDCDDGDDAERVHDVQKAIRRLNSCGFDAERVAARAGTGLTVERVRELQRGALATTAERDAIEGVQRVRPSLSPRQRRERRERREQPDTATSSPPPRRRHIPEMFPVGVLIAAMLRAGWTEATLAKASKIPKGRLKVLLEGEAAAVCERELLDQVLRDPAPGAEKRGPLRDYIQPLMREVAA